MNTHSPQIHKTANFCCPNTSSLSPPKPGPLTELPQALPGACPHREAAAILGRQGSGNTPRPPGIQGREYPIAMRDPEAGTPHRGAGEPPCLPAGPGMGGWEQPQLQAVPPSPGAAQLRAVTDCMCCNQPLALAHLLLALLNVQSICFL